MRDRCWTACPVLFMIVTSAFSKEATLPPDAELSTADRAQMDLGQAGLMRAYFDSDQFGSVQWRVGQERITVGDAGSSGRPHSAYKDDTTDTILPLNAMFDLPGGNSVLRLGVKTTLTNGGDNLVELDGHINRIDLAYLNFSVPNMMWGIGGFYEDTSIDIESGGTVKRPAGGVKADLLYSFSPHWGLAALAEYSFGENDVSVQIAPQVTMRHKQGDDYLYTQGQLIGQFRSTDNAHIPDGWVLSPVLGAQFRRSFIESNANSFGVVSAGVAGATEDYGTVWGHLRLEKEAPPGNWAPNVLIGMEREYANDLDTVVREPTYAVVGAGMSTVFGRGNRFDASYTRHQGLHGNRWNQGIAAALTMKF